MMKKITYLLILLLAFNFSYGQTTLAKEDIAIIGVNTDNEDFTFLLRTDITIGTQIYFSDNEVNATGTGLNDSNEGIILFTAAANYSCGTVISYINNSSEFSSAFGSFILANGGDEVLAFQGYVSATLTWTTFLHANVDVTIVYPTGFTAVDIVDGNRDNREYIGTTVNSSWTDLNTFANYDHQNNYGGVTLSTTAFTCAPCPNSITWNGAWSNGTGPGLLLDTEVTLITSYDTATNGGSFSACNLTVNNLATLNIADNDYIEVQNDVTVDAGGIINVEPYGAFIQNNDLGNVVNNGTITVTKETAPLNNWYEYTYWSSPVSDAIVGVALTDSDADRRFIFNASQFNDEVAEVGNNNATVLGQDDIDDEGNDWQWVNSATTMQPGVGYAATHSEAAFIIPPGPFTPPQFRYTFEGGIFNNGIIGVPVDRNDVTALDFNWNLIGNPYPSAVDIDAFMTQNMYDVATNPSGALEGVIYFWSQNTDYAANANGNEALNFDTTDYATHNGMGGTMGGDGLTPNGFIPSGQAFFVSFSDDFATNSGTVVFNNAMRSLSLSPDNSQFFRNSNSKKKTSNSANKLWVNLTSDNGVFNQILIGYAEGATNNDDGAYYDARKIVAPKAFSALYSTIENIDKKFAIQGKAADSLNEDEIISLGFSTNIDIATLYTLSIAQLEGDFLASNTIYLKDNLLNTLHDLSASDYTFTSEVGEFNDRFEIVFNANALSTKDISANANTLKIIELEADNVKFTASEPIKTIKIFDLLGRQLYYFKGQNDSETYKLSNLSSSIYIAKVELYNGVIITKKAFKK